MGTHGAGRLVTANLSITLDGRFHGPGGPTDLAPIVPYAVTDVARDHLARIHDGATTAVLSRGNAEGFLGWWSPIADDESADPRDRDYARWLVGVDKVVLSRTRTELPHAHTVVRNEAPESVVRGLRAEEGGSILVNTSPSLLKPLLAVDLVDRMRAHQQDGHRGLHPVIEVALVAIVVEAVGRLAREVVVARLAMEAILRWSPSE